MTHSIGIEVVGGEPSLEFWCDSPADAPCRRRPLEPGLPEWDSTVPVDDGGHECWLVEWVEATSVYDAIRVFTRHDRIGVVPVNIEFYDGPKVTLIEEPTDAEVEAAAAVIWHETANDDDQLDYTTIARAALHAAKGALWAEQ